VWVQPFFPNFFVGKAGGFLVHCFFFLPPDARVIAQFFFLIGFFAFPPPLVVGLSVLL